MKTKKFIFILAVIGIYLNTVSCVFNTIKGNGNLKTFEKSVASFEKIDVGSSAKVNFHASPDYKMVVTVDENLEQYLEIATQGNVLNIGIKPGSYSFTKFQVNLYCPVLTGVGVSGAGSFVTTDTISTPTFDSDVSGAGKIEGIIVKCDKFSANISGAGKMNITGTSKDAVIDISGAGKFNGSEFTVNNATVSVSGAGNADLSVTDNLKADASGAGHINYRGDPKTNTSVSGAGKVNKM